MCFEPYAEKCLDHCRVWLLVCWYTKHTIKNSRDWKDKAEDDFFYLSFFFVVFFFFLGGGDKTGLRNFSSTKCFLFCFCLVVVFFFLLLLLLFFLRGGGRFLSKNRNENVKRKSVRSIPEKVNRTQHWTSNDNKTRTMQTFFKYFQKSFLWRIKKLYE